MNEEPRILSDGTIGVTWSGTKNWKIRKISKVSGATYISDVVFSTTFLTLMPCLNLKPLGRFFCQTFESPAYIFSVEEDYLQFC